MRRCPPPVSGAPYGSAGRRTSGAGRGRGGRNVSLVTAQCQQCITVFYTFITSAVPACYACTTGQYKWCPLASSTHVTVLDDHANTSTFPPPISHPHKPKPITPLSYFHPNLPPLAHHPSFQLPPPGFLPQASRVKLQFGLSASYDVRPAGGRWWLVFTWFSQSILCDTSRGVVGRTWRRISSLTYCRWPRRRSLWD